MNRLYDACLGQNYFWSPLRVRYVEFIECVKDNLHKNIKMIFRILQKIGLLLDATTDILKMLLYCHGDQGQ
jgi:hypothetical protein